MKQINFFVLLIFLSVFAGVLAVVGSAAGDAQETAGKTAPTTEELARRYPIAPGIWYPTDGPIPENPVRYYRVRCWPGCHTGSTYGKYPDKPLTMKPIWPTSTINAHSGVPQTTE